MKSKPMEDFDTKLSKFATENVNTKNNSDFLDIESITESDSDYNYIEIGRFERIYYPQNYGNLNDIDWNHNGNYNFKSER